MKPLLFPLRRLSGFLMFASLSLTPSNLAADCIAVPPEVLRVRVEKCQTPADFAAERLGHVDLGWVTHFAEKAVQHKPGLVLTGAVVERQEVEWFGPGDFVIGPLLQTEELGTWFVEERGGNGCADWKAGAVAQVYKQHPCCDILPPDDMPCMFEIGWLKPVPAEVRERLEKPDTP